MEGQTRRVNLVNRNVEMHVVRVVVDHSESVSKDSEELACLMIAGGLDVLAKTIPRPT
jgi:hypothetical protein